MKTFFTFLVCLVLALASPAGAAAREITASVFPVWLLLREVARDVPGVNLSLLLPPGTGCPHDYAMTVQDRRALARADVLVVNGLGLESFLGEEGRAGKLQLQSVRVRFFCQHSAGSADSDADGVFAAVASGIRQSRLRRADGTGRYPPEQHIQHRHRAGPDLQQSFHYRR